MLRNIQLLYRLHAVQLITLETDMQRNVSNYAVKELFDTSFRIKQNFQEVLYDLEISVLVVNQ